MIKKRYIVILCVILMIVFGSVIALTKPVLPTIQIPGEVYPGTEGLLPQALFNGTGITNTFVATVIMWILMLILAFGLRARSRTADDVPTGFYNIFEMIFEGAYNFAERIAGSKVRVLLPYFMTFILMILLANWMELVPGVDSIGMWEFLPHLEGVEAAAVAEQEAAAIGEELSPEELEEIVHSVTEVIAAENVGDLRVNFWLLNAASNASDTAELEPGPHEGEYVGANPEAADWTIVPFVRAAATDLNFTIAFALVSMFLVQYYGFKYLGGRTYLVKFFPFISPGFGKAVGKNPIKAIDPAVGLLELISEVSKILSFSFRLFGNIFAGQVLLFVMAFILPVANIVFFGLELFVGVIQAAVFALLSLIFMAGATESHDHYDSEDGHH